MKPSTRALYRLGAVAVILAAAWILVPRFGTESNLINLLRQAFLLALVATGVSLSMLVAGLDLSIGAVAALSSCLAATVIVQGHVALGILVGLAVGALGGFLNGMMIAKLKLPFFIMTFSMMFIIRGLALTYTQGTSIHGFPGRFTWLGKSFVGPIPMPVVLGVAVLGLLHLVLTKTTFGRITYAVGANAEAARFSGLSADRNIIRRRRRHFRDAGRGSAGHRRRRLDASTDRAHLRVSKPGQHIDDVAFRDAGQSSRERRDLRRGGASRAHARVGHAAGGSE